MHGHHLRRSWLSLAKSVQREFQRCFRDGCLNHWLFPTIREAQELTDAWLYEYNHERPHGSIGGLTPAQFEQHHWQNDRSVLKKGMSGINFGLVSGSWASQSFCRSLSFKLTSFAGENRIIRAGCPEVKLHNGGVSKIWGAYPCMTIKLTPI